jgi:hypothetical protein
MMNVDKYKKLLLPVFISMSMVACGGGGGSSDAGTTQPPISENQTAVQAMVQSSDGSLLKGVTVSVLDQKAITNENGIAQLNVKVPKGISEVVVKYEAEGFVNQSVLVKTSELTNVTGHMLFAKDLVPVDEIEKAQVIKATSLDATISIPENAFVKANGSFAQGKVNVYFTPWDINSNDLNAMPANGFALDAQGNRAQLISAGMITATFIDAATGEKLQLAPNKTADIQMNVPFSSINNTKLSEGTKIPMWHFDESKGLWVEEGEGEVVKSVNSSTGLAVKATVSHFSTWNWDFKINATGSVFVQCQSEGQAIPCAVTADVTLPDQSKFNYSMSINNQGDTIINMPSDASIRWTAKDSTGSMIGEKVSGTSGNVIIDLGKPTTDNFVKCVLPNGQTTFCTVELNSEYKFSITDKGSKILTGIQDANLTWVAKSQIFFEDNQWKRHTGTLVSGPKGDLIIQLSEKELLDQNGLAYTMYCSHLENGGFPSSWEADPKFIGKVCTIEVRVYLNANPPSDYFEVFEFKGLYGQPIEIKLPSEYSGYSHTGKGNVDIIEFRGFLEGTSNTGGFLVEFEDRFPDPNSTQILFFNLN